VRFESTLGDTESFPGSSSRLCPTIFRSPRRVLRGPRSRRQVRPGRHHLSCQNSTNRPCRFRLPRVCSTRPSLTGTEIGSSDRSGWDADSPQPARSMGAGIACHHSGRGRARHRASLGGSLVPESAVRWHRRSHGHWGQPRRAGPKRVMRSLARRVRRRIFLPGDSLADGVKRACGFVLGLGALIGLLTWGAYRQGILHGRWRGITFCAVLFLLCRSCGA